MSMVFEQAEHMRVSSWQRSGDSLSQCGKQMLDSIEMQGRARAERWQLFSLHGWQTPTHASIEPRAASVNLPARQTGVVHTCRTDQGKVCG